MGGGGRQTFFKLQKAGVVVLCRRTYPKEQWKALSIEAHPEVLRVEPEGLFRGGDDLLEEGSHPLQDLAELAIVEHLLLVDLGQFLAQGYRVLPMLSTLKQVHNV